MTGSPAHRSAVVSCHVERPLDDAVWARFSRLQERRPSGFAVAALMRPADPAAGEDEALWLERARAAASRGPLGQHTHWTSPTHARPTSSTDVPPARPAGVGGHAALGGQATQRHEGAGERVREEGLRLRELGLEPTLFCGGGWYADAEVAHACVELGYADCTPRATRPAYLADGEPWACLTAPSRVVLPSGRRLLALPTTHSVGDLARALARRRALPQVVHVYFHDTDLLGRRRRALLRALLPLLARTAVPTDLDALRASLAGEAPETPWVDVKRP